MTSLSILTTHGLLLFIGAELIFSLTPGPTVMMISAYGFKQSHIAVAVHHPMVWSVAVFGAAHLIANGSAADVLLFVAFFVWAVVDLFSAYARDRRNAIVYPTPNWGATIGAIVVGVLIWGLLIGGLHLWLFGVSPLAM